MTKRVVIVGGGVAGLGAAYKVRRAVEAGHDVEFVLLERDSRLGGKLATERIPDPEGRGEFVVDGGSDSFLTDKPAVHRVAKLLGIFEDETGTLDENKKTFIVKGGRLVEMPDGIMMFAPTKILPMATTPLYSWPGKLRMALDLVIPRKKLKPGSATTSPSRASSCAEWAASASIGSPSRSWVASTARTRPRCRWPRRIPICSAWSSSTDRW